MTEEGGKAENRERGEGGIERTGGEDREREAGASEEGGEKVLGREGEEGDKELLPIQGLEKPAPIGIRPDPNAYRAVTSSLTPSPILTWLPGSSG